MLYFFIMPLIDDGHASVTETIDDMWNNELINSRILLSALDSAIYAITNTNIQSYELDTGQTKQRVTRADLPALISQRQNLINSIRELEISLGVGTPAIKQVGGYW